MFITQGDFFLKYIDIRVPHLGIMSKLTFRVGQWRVTGLPINCLYMNFNFILITNLQCKLKIYNLKTYHINISYSVPSVFVGCSEAVGLGDGSVITGTQTSVSSQYYTGGVYSSTHAGILGYSGPAELGTYWSPDPGSYTDAYIMVIIFQSPYYGWCAFCLWQFHLL